MDYVGIYSSYEGREDLLERVKNVYRNYGYSIELDFPKEYYFMHNPDTGEKVRIYYRGSIQEYH